MDHVVSQYHIKEQGQEIDQYRVLQMTVSEKPEKKVEKVEDSFRQFASPTKSLCDKRSETDKKEKRIT